MYQQTMYINVWMHVTISGFDAISEAAVVSLDDINPCPVYIHDVQTVFFQQHFKFHPYQIKYVRENEANWFCFPPILLPSAKV